MIEIVEQFPREHITKLDQLKVGQVYRRVFYTTEDGRHPMILDIARSTGIPALSKLHDYWLATSDESLVSMSGYVTDFSEISPDTCHFEKVRTKMTVLGD